MSERCWPVGPWNWPQKPAPGTTVTLRVPVEERLMPVPLSTRILLADDHALVRGGLKMVLESQPDLTVVAEAGDGAEALEVGLRTRSTWQCLTSRCRS